MIRPLSLAAFALALYASPAFAETCDTCPRVQLLRAGDQVRIAAEDDNDAYEDLRHRVRVVTDDLTTEWTAWADTNAYAITAVIDGSIEAETVDLDGEIGRGTIRITAPTTTSPRGPGTVQEDSSTEARWSDTTDEATTTRADLPPEEDAWRPAPELYLDAEDWDHTVCPVASGDDDDAPLCSSTQQPPPTGLALLSCVIGGLLIRRRD